MRTPRSWPPRVLAALRERCGITAAIDLRIVKRIRVDGKSASATGLCVRLGDGRGFRVYVQAGMPWEATRETLVHELAHVLTPRNADHGPAWSLAYGKCYRASLRWWEIA